MILSRWTYLQDSDLEIVFDALLYRREMIGSVACGEHISNVDREINTKLHKRLTEIIDEIKRERYGRKSDDWDEVRRQQFTVRNLEIKPM